LKYRHILHQVYIKEADHEFLESNQLNVIENVAYDLRGKLLSVFEKYIKDPSELGVVSALVLGYNNAVPDELYQAFSNSGAVHVLAVSGMHVGIVASFFLFFLNLFKSKSNYWKIFKFIILLFVVWMFTFVTGAAPAVMRSAVMFTLIWIGKYWFENQNLFNILSASAFGMLFVDPYLLFHASFQFSYSAMWSLMFFQPHISRMLAFRSKFGNYLWNLISSSISAQVLVFPITIYFFHKFPLYFILSGVVAVITGVLALYLGLIVLVVEFVFQPLNIIIAKIFQLSSSLFIASVRWVKDLPGSSIDGLWMSETEFLLIYLTIFTIMLYMIIKSKKLIFLTGIFILTYIISFTEKKINSKNFIGFTVYDSFNTTLIDFFDGKDLYTYSSEVLTDDDMRFVCYNNRYYRGTSNNFSIKIPNNFEGLRIKQEGNIIRLKNQVVYIAKGEVDTNLVKISHFIVGLEETKWSIKGQNENLYNNKTIILDKSSKLGSVYKVRKLCKLPACKIHEINIEGSYNLEAI
jgi:competence protein ComEC